MSKTFFASDFHLDPDHPDNAAREKRICQWLDMVKQSGDTLYLVGDLFDFWHDYKHVVPKGTVHFLSKVKELADHGIDITVFSGNHDLWLNGYFEEELGVKVEMQGITAEIGSKDFYIAHGDGLGPGDHGYKFIKKVFTNKVCQWLFKWIHPDLGIPLARYFSRSSREAEPAEEKRFLGEDKEWLIMHSKEVLENRHFDYLIYGHRHLPMVYPLSNSLHINLGDWINHFTFGEFDGHNFELKIFNQDGSILPFNTPKY